MKEKREKKAIQGYLNSSPPRRGSDPSFTHEPVAARGVPAASRQRAATAVGEDRLPTRLCITAGLWRNLLFTPRKGYGDNAITSKDEEAPFFFFLRAERLNINPWMQTPPVKID